MQAPVELEAIRVMVPAVLTYFIAATTGRCVGTRGVADRKASLPGRAHRCLGWMCKHPGMDMTLRFEIFPQDLNVIVDFYSRVLGFSVTRDQRGDPDAYVALRRGAVHVGAARRAGPAVRAERRPPIGVELVLEVDDIATERDRIVAAGWPLEED